MNIAHFTNTYKPNINGVSRSVSLFRETLDKLGHNVFVFAPGGGGYEDTEPFIFRFPAFEIKQFNYSISIPMSSHINWVLPRLKLDVIHSNHPILLGDIAANRAEKLGLPLVFTFHTRYTEYSHYVPLNQAFIKGVITEGLARYLRRCQHIITPSDSIKDMLVDNGVIDGVTTIPTGLELGKFKSADGNEIRSRFSWDDNFVLVTMGRLTKEKNFEILLESASKVIAQDSNVRLLVIGDGPQRDELENLARELGITDQTVFTGRVSFNEVPSYLKAGDLFCYSSVTETQGLVTMEALSAGLPVVAVDATGTGDVVRDGFDGLLVENDSKELAHEIERVINDVLLQERLKANALESAKEFDIMSQAEKTLEVYRQAIEAKKDGFSIEVDQIKYT